MNDLTTVELLWLEKRIENQIRFGRPVAEQIIDRRRILSFAPGTRLCVRTMGIQGFWNSHRPCRHLARSEARTTLFDGAMGQAGR